ncbi:MAG TPA: helix-turn-helix transcriptional regulator, partial [Pseudonocardiaceae bacterium]|nr:helix-turn-helix transcriptional regulator [Pseudonocardiaceae bacterium]
VGRAVRLAGQRRQVLPLGWLLLSGGLAALVHGELAGARQWLREAAAVTASWGDGHLGRLASSFGSLADAVRGAAPEPAAAEPAVTAAGTGTEPGWLRALDSYALARRRLLVADPVGCMAALAHTGGAVAAELFVRAAIEAGDVPAGRRRLDELAPSPGGAVLRAYTMLAGARLALVEQDGGQDAKPGAARAAELAAELAVAARDTFARHGMRLAAGEAGVVAGRAQAASGEHRAALLTLRLADETLLGCGAARLGDEAARELRRLGRHVDRRVRSAANRYHSSQALTGREDEIARLVADGMTNRQIAGALFISEKTVERHLSSVYLKLRISSRAAVALRLVST